LGQEGALNLEIVDISENEIFPGNRIEYRKSSETDELECLTDI